MLNAKEKLQEILRLGTELTEVNDLDLLLEKTGKAGGRNAGKNLTFLLRRIDSFLKSIEGNQMLQIVRQKEEQGVLFEVPVFFSEGIRTLRLYMKNRENNKGKVKTGKDHFYLLFLLDFPFLGNLKIDLVVIEKRLALKIAAEKEAVLDFLRQFIPRLKERFLNVGFFLERTDFIPLHESSSPSPVPEEDIILRDVRMVDMKI